MFLYGLM